MSEQTTEVQVRGIHNSSDDSFLGVMSAMQMHGRRQIFTNEREITGGNVVSVLNKALQTHNANRQEEVYLEKYLRGVQPILDRVKQYNDYVCNRVVVNVANQIVTFKTAEFAGEPIQYVSRGNRPDVPEKIDRLNAMMLSEGKSSKDMDMAYKMFTCGTSYRLVLNDKATDYAKGVLFDEAPFEIYVPDPRNTFVIRRNDVGRKVIAGVTYVFLDEQDQKVQYTVYTENEAFVLEGNAQSAGKLVGSSVHNTGLVPLVEYPCNSVRMGAFEVVLPMLDAYNLTMSDRLDGVEQFIQALMVFEGVDITREEFLELKDLGAIKLPPSLDGRSSKVYYLNQQLDQQQTQTLVDDMYQTILQIVGMPSQGNANTSDSSNNGAILLKNGWWSAESRALETEGQWREAETEFLKIVLKICRDANALDGLAVSDVKVKFGRRSYEDKLTKVQSFTMLMDKSVPPIQAYTYSGIASDPEADAIAFDKYQKDREAEEEARLDAEADRERERIASARAGREVERASNAGTVQSGGQVAFPAEQADTP